MSNMCSQATSNCISLLDITQYGSEVAIRERVGLLFRGSSCSSATACSTGRSRCGPGCRCKNCSNSVIAVITAPGTQQENPTELVEVEEEELLHDSVLTNAYGLECMEG